MTPEERAEAIVNTDSFARREIAEAIRAAVAEEREECAKVAKRTGSHEGDQHCGLQGCCGAWIPDEIAVAIRVRPLTASPPRR